MLLTLEIIKVSKPEKKPGKGGGYESLEVTYKDLTGGGKVGGKKLVSFGPYKHVFEVAKGWAEGQVINVEIEKIDGYWAWTSTTEGEAPDVSPTQESPKVDAPKATKQQWVPDEVRQRLIVRQSALERAISYEVYQNNSASIEDVLSTAERFVDWVFEVEPEEKPKRGRKAKAEVEVE